MATSSAATPASSSDALPMRRVAKAAVAAAVETAGSTGVIAAQNWK